MNNNTGKTNSSATDLHFSLAVIGGGPIGMHILGRAVTEGLVAAQNAVIVDPHDQPFAQWHRRVGNCRMRFLRSPASHGIARDYRTIRRSMQTNQDFTPPYHRPSVDIFSEHLRRHADLTLTERNHLPGWARTIHPAGSSGRYRIEVAQHGTIRSITADAIILAVGQPPVRIPAPIAALPASAPAYHVHEDTSSLDNLPHGSSVGIVGGGIAAAHLAIALSDAGHHVTMWNRDRFTRHQFDSDPCFVGPRCASLFASVSTYRARRALIQRSRRGGSVPPDLFSQLRRYEQSRMIRMMRGEVIKAGLSGKRVFLHGRGGIRGGSDQSMPGPRLVGEYDAVVACTGFAAGPPARDLVEQVSRELNLELSEDGYPIPAPDLQWAPGLFVAGALGELETGPPARNLVGAHVAGRRIIPALPAFLTDRKSR